MSFLKGRGSAEGHSNYKHIQALPCLHLSQRTMHNFAILFWVVLKTASRLVDAYNCLLICFSLLINKGSLIKGLCLCHWLLLTLSPFHMYFGFSLWVYSLNCSGSPPLPSEQPRTAVLTTMHLGPIAQNRASIHHSLRHQLKLWSVCVCFETREGGS